MGNIVVDQIGVDGGLLQAPDKTLSESAKNRLLLDSLPTATVEQYHGVRVVRFVDQLIMKKQITHLGHPWPAFKKRIQVPRTWLEAERRARAEGLVPRFVGIYHHEGVTIFVDFDPSTYVGRKANNSAAHVATNDLYQAQTLGQFSRTDRNGNRLTSVRADELASYLRSGYDERNPHLEILDRFSDAFLDGARLEGLAAVQEMYAAGWPDKFQNEWAGFYVEFRLSRFLRENKLRGWLDVQKEKRKGEFDYDLRFLAHGKLEHYGDLKASNIEVSDSPGNDAENFYRCLSETGRFWYVIYEHETWHGRDNGNTSTVAWNDWRRSVGHIGRGGVYDPLSYAGRFKEAVRFVGVKILEVNHANAGMVLGDFQKNFRQPDGKPRKGKVMIRKRDIDNFLIYTKTIESAGF